MVVLKSYFFRRHSSFLPGKSNGFDFFGTVTLGFGVDRIRTFVSGGRQD